MALYLVQHGKNLSKDVDPEKGLSEQGMEEVQRIASTAKQYGIPVERIVHSGKKRALQTAEIFSNSLGIRDKLAERQDIGPLDDVAAFARTLDDAPNMMVIGHLPFLEKLTGYLVAGDPENRVFRFQNGGIVCVDQDSDKGGWCIRWALMPNIS